MFSQSPHIAPLPTLSHPLAHVALYVFFLSSHLAVIGTLASEGFRQWTLIAVLHTGASHLHALIAQILSLSYPAHQSRSQPIVTFSDRALVK